MLETIPSVLTHNGIFTVYNPKTGNHRTFQIKTVKKGGLKGKRIISMLIGPDNNSDYLPIAFVTTYEIIPFNKYKGTQYEKLVNVLLNVEKFGMEVKASTKCRVCNRRLTEINSLIHGIGPTCRENI
jgi:hypothetical protein